MTPDARRLRTGRWLVLAVPASIYVVSYFHRVAPAVVAADLMRTFAITARALGSLAAIYPYVFVAMALGAGVLADTLGSRRTLALGAVTMGVGAAVFGLAPTFVVAYGGRLLVAIGASVILIAWLALAAEWFRPGEFGTISGFTQAVGNVGALVASSPLALLVEALGWRLTFVMIGGVTLLLGLLAVTLVRDRPEAVGLAPVNAARAARSPTALRDVARAIPGLVGNPRTWPPVLATAGVYASLVAFQGLWAVPYLTEVYGLGRVRAANTVALLAIGMALGAPFVGWLSDRVLGRRRLPMAAFTAVFAACWVPLAAPGGLRVDASLLGPFFFLMGFASAGLVLVWTCVREVNDPERVGLAVGFCNMPVFLAFAVIQWLTGVILDARWAGASAGGARVYPAVAYEAAFTVCLGVSVAAVVAACLVTETRCRNLWCGGRRP